MSNVATPHSGTGSNTSFGQSVDVQVAWRDIKYSVTVGGKKREILCGLTGNALARRTLAVMGSSGAGKTTFVNALSGRLASDGKDTILSGNRYLNNVEYERKYRTMVGYVTQDDILNPMSTPEESFSFSLRCRRGTDPEETVEAVDKMIEELNLEKARKTIVGVPGLVQGLSGGERKRTNIGVELITNPKILYLDEPTSGLDSVTATRICETLQKLARRGRTVVFSIHQPTAKCVSFFDDLMLMVKGGIIYHGPMENAVEYFTSIGYECPTSYTPTDYFMTLMQNDEVQDMLIEKWTEFLDKRNRDEYAYTAPPTVDNESFTERYLTSYSSSARASKLIEFTELMQRSTNNVVRNKMLIAATLIQNIFFGIVVALIFANLEDNVTGISDRFGLLFMITTNIGFSSVTAVINNFGPQKAVYIRDQQSGAYNSGIFHLTTFVADLPLNAICLFLQAIIVYFSTRLVLGADNFFLFYAIMLATQQVGNSIGMAISVGIDNYIVATGVAPMVVIPFMLCSGLLASTDRLRPYWVWLEKPSFLRAGALLLFHNEFDNLGSISCDVGKYGQEFCDRQPQDGPAVLRAFDFADRQAEPWVQWVVLACVFVFARILVQLLLIKVAHTKA